MLKYILLLDIVLCLSCVYYCGLLVLLNSSQPVDTIVQKVILVNKCLQIKEIIVLLSLIIDEIHREIKNTITQ